MQVKAAVYHVTPGNGANRVLGQAGFIWEEVIKLHIYIPSMLFQYRGTQNKVFKHLIYYILEHIDLHCFTGKGIRSTFFPRRSYFMLAINLLF